MESITMTNATQVERSRSVCPQVADCRLITAVNGVRQGTTVSTEGTVTPVVLGAPIEGITVSAFGFGTKVSARTDFFVAVVPAATYAQTQQFASTDVAYLRSGRPPV